MNDPVARTPGMVLDAPSNLGLRPPAPGSVPGADKAPAALREAGLHRALTDAGWREGGVVVAGRYAPEVPAGGVRNQTAIVDHARRLAERLSDAFAGGSQVLALGGDCSILLGAALALRRRGRYGLVHIDGHTDFRHPGNSGEAAALGGEDLAAVTGRHYPQIADIDGLAPYIDPRDAVHIGCRDDDVWAAECRTLLGDVISAGEWIADAESAEARIRRVVSRPDLDGFWIHVDVDVIDPRYVSAVDSPDPGGVDPGRLSELLGALWPESMGGEICILDPDLDPAGDDARTVAGIVIAALGCPGT